QEWRAYNTERTELGNYIQNSGVKLIRIHGDTHSLAADSGANNPYGGFPFISAAPLGTTAHPFPGHAPVDSGSFPAQTTNSSRHFGEYEVLHSPEQTSIQFHGYAWNGTEYIEQVSMTTTWSMLPPEPDTPPVVLSEVWYQGSKATELWMNGTRI